MALEQENVVKNVDESLKNNEIIVKEQSTVPENGRAVVQNVQIQLHDIKFDQLADASPTGLSELPTTIDFADEQGPLHRKKFVGIFFGAQFESYVDEHTGETREGIKVHLVVPFHENKPVLPEQIKELLVKGIKPEMRTLKSGAWRLQSYFIERDEKNKNVIRGYKKPQGYAVMVEHKGFEKKANRNSVLLDIQTLVLK